MENDMSTIDEKIKRFKEIQQAIFVMAERAENIITCYGSANEVRTALVQIRQESMNMFEVVSDLENEAYDAKEPELHGLENETSDMPSLPMDVDAPEFEFFGEKDVDGKPFISYPADHTCSMDDDRVIIFFTGCRRINHDNNKEHFSNVPLDKFKMTQGKRYIKVIRGGSVHCFIDRTNGDVLKAASWSAPARHSRGNIWDDFNGLNGMTEYGAAYLRG